VDRPPGVDRLRDFFKFVATADTAAIFGILTIYPNVGLPRDQAVGLVAFLGTSLLACVWGMLRLTYSSMTRGHREDVGWLERGCYWVALSGLIGGVVGFIVTALVI